MGGLARCLVAVSVAACLSSGLCVVADGRFSAAAWLRVWLRIGCLVAAARLLGGSARAVGMFLDGRLICHWMLLRCCSAVVWLSYGSCVVAVGLVSDCFA